MRIIFQTRWPGVLCHCPSELCELICCPMIQRIWLNMKWVFLSLNGGIPKRFQVLIIFCRETPMVVAGFPQFLGGFPQIVLREILPWKLTYIPWKIMVYGWSPWKWNLSQQKMVQILGRGHSWDFWVVGRLMVHKGQKVNKSIPLELNRKSVPFGFRQILRYGFFLAKVPVESHLSINV